MKIEIRFGALAPPLTEQLAGREFSAMGMLTLQKFADDVAFLKVHGILPDAQAHACRKRILKRICRMVKP